MQINETMGAAVLTEYKNIEWRQVPVPAIGESEVLIKVGYAGICGSDQHIFTGDFHPRTKTPMIPGHEFTGTIVKVGKNVKTHKIGDRVVVDPIIPCGKCAACEIQHYPACTSLKLLGVDIDGGFAEYVAADERMLYKIGSEISDRHAALIEVLSIGFHAVNRAGLKKDDTVAIYGSGRIGHCIAQATRTRTDNTIFMVDILSNRLDMAERSYDNIVVINSKEIDPVAFIHKHTNGRGVDVAFEAVGHVHPVENRVHPVRECVQSIRGAGTVCVLGLPDDPAPLNMKEFIWKEARIVASRVSHGEFAETIHHLSLGHLNPEALISSEFSASIAQDAFEILEKEPQNYLKILLKLS